MIRRTLAALAATACVLLVAGCGDDEPDPDASSETTPSPTPEPSVTASDAPSETTQPSPTPPPSSAAPEGRTIEITFSGDDVTPNGDRVQVTAGEPVTLDVTADVAGEIHVHSDPEQELEYGAGETSLKLVIDRPGIVEVESHDLDKVIVQLEVQP